MRITFRADRLAVLARHLEKLQRTPEDQRPRTFIINAWGARDPARVLLGEVACTTAACAFGEAALIPAFEAEGLRLVPATNSTSVRSLVPVYRVGNKGYFELDAAQKFFGLTRKQAEHLFMPDEYASSVGPGTVARRIRKMLRDGKKEAA